MAMAVTELSINPMDDARTAAQRIIRRSPGAQKKTDTGAVPGVRIMSVIAKLVSAGFCCGLSGRAHRGGAGGTTVGQRVFLALDGSFEMRT